MRFALKLELPPFSGVSDCPQSPWVSGSPESLRALVRRKGGLPSPGKILFAALSPHRRAHLAARIQRRAPSAGALNPLHPAPSRREAGADPARELAGPAILTLRPTPGARGAQAQLQRVPTRAGRPGRRARPPGRPHNLGRPVFPGRGARTGSGGGPSKPQGSRLEAIRARVSPLRPSRGSSLKSPRLLGDIRKLRRGSSPPKGRVHADPTPRRTCRLPRRPERAGGLPSGDLWDQ